MQSVGDRPTAQLSTPPKNLLGGAPPRVHFCCGRASVRLESLQLLRRHVRNCGRARALEVLQRLLQDRECRLLLPGPPTLEARTIRSVRRLVVSSHKHGYVRTRSLRGHLVNQRECREAELPLRGSDK